MTPEIRARLSMVGKQIANIDRLARVTESNKGKHPTQETRAKMSAAQKGRTRPPEHATRISAGIKLWWSNRKKDNKTVLHTPESKKKISESVKIFWAKNKVNKKDK